MAEAILPPVATRPDEACQLVAAALSDGDLAAALVHYEPTAVTSPGDGRTVRGAAELHVLLADAAAARLLYTVAVRSTLHADTLALVSGTWSSAGRDVDGNPSRRSGRYWSVVRRAEDGTWRIALEVIEVNEPDESEGN